MEYGGNRCDPATSGCTPARARVVMIVTIKIISLSRLAVNCGFRVLAGNPGTHAVHLKPDRFEKISLSQVMLVILMAIKKVEASKQASNNYAVPAFAIYQIKTIHISSRLSKFKFETPKVE